MSQTPRALAFLAAAALTFGPCAAGYADEPGPAGKESPRSLNDLSLEVAALQTIYALNLSPRQVEKLRKLAGDTVDHSSVRQTPKGSAHLRKLLSALRAALIKGEDDNQIDALIKKLDNLRTSEKPELDDGVDITDEARTHAREAVRLLTPSQVASYMGGMADDISDPLDMLLDALTRARTVDGKEWRELREGVSDEVGRLVAGVDAEQAQSIADRVTQLLILARGLKEADFKKQRHDLEKSARQIVGDAGPFEVMRHVLEQSLAEFLSNPLLPAALDARLAYVRRSALVQRKPRP